MNNICVIGLGYVGLPTALIASEKFNVLGVDIDTKLITNLNNQRFHSEEIEITKKLNEATLSKRISFSEKPNFSDVFVLAVPTPVDKNHNASLNYVYDAIDSILPYLRQGNLIIIESTSPIGTTVNIQKYLLNELGEIDEIYISYCPERVLPGDTINEIRNNDRIIGGICNKSSELTTEFYSKFVIGNLHVTNSKTAEACKLVENSYRDFQIAFANELSMNFNDDSEIDVFNLINLANKHPRINILSPGVGVGGHCIAVDPYFLIDHNPQKTKLIQLSRTINLEKTDWVISIIEQALNSKIDRKKTTIKVCIFGITYKPNSSDLRESPALKILNEIASKNLKINLMYSDPWLKEDLEIKNVSKIKNLENLDLAVICVAHEEFQKINFPKQNTLDFTGKIQ